MKKIKDIFRRYMLIVLSVSGGFLILIYSMFEFYVMMNQQRGLLDHLILQTTSVLDERHNELEEFEELIKQDYLIRARAFEEMVFENPDIIENQEKLVSIANTLSVDALEVVSEEGIIIGSSAENRLGFDFHTSSQAREFLFLIDSTDETASYVQEMQKNTVDQEESSYIGVKCRAHCGFIQISIGPEGLKGYWNQASIRTVLSRLPMIEGHLLFALNSHTGDLIGHSAAYEGNSVSFKDQLESLKSSTDGKWLKIGNDTYYLVTQAYDDLLLIAASSSQIIYSKIAWLIGFMTLITLLLVILVIKLINYLINKKLIQDIEQILQTLNEFKKGEFDIEIGEMSSYELSQIATSINQIVKMIKKFNHKLIHIIDVTKLPIVLFEYIENLNQIFITENTCDILNLDQESFNEIKGDCQKFRTFLSTLKQNPLESHQDIYELPNSKYVKITMFDEANEWYGVIQDVTPTILERQNMMCELDESRRLARTDYLTGLFNKLAVYEMVSTYLATNQVGILLLFDLDNFKVINDTKGHMEGDYVLQLFAKTIKSEFREKDIVGRLGGDEFVVFLPSNMTKQHLETKLTQLIECIRKTFKLYYESCGLSISIGSAKVTSEINTFNQLYVAADQRLYIAKKNGKDKFYID